MQYRYKNSQYNKEPAIMEGPYFKPDPQVARGTEKNCNDCQKKFSIRLREHQCKRCLKAVCSDCGSYRRDVFQTTTPKSNDHRVCKDCHQASSYISDCVKNEDLKFGQTGDTGKKWLKRMTNKPSTFGTDDSQHRLLTRQVFSQLWTSYSFELRELVGLQTIKFKQDSVYDVVYNVYATVVSAARQFTLAQVIHLAVFVLCFCAQDKAPFIVLYLLQLRQNQKDLKTLAMNYLKALPFKNQLSKLDSYIGYRLDRYSDSFFVNCLTIQCAKSLITRTFQKKNIQEMLIFFATHIFINRQQLVSKISQKTQLSVKSAQMMMYLDRIMLRNCKLEQLTSCYKYFKGKIFSPDAKDPLSEELNHLSLRKMKTLNFQPSYSPKNELQLGNQRNRPRLLSRESYNENNKESMDDSFSIYLQDENQITMKKTVCMKSPTSTKNQIIDQPSQSPKVKLFIPSGQESPFRKSTEQPVIEQIHSPSNQKSGKTCDNCLLIQEQYNILEGRCRDERIIWQKQKQSLEQMSETLNGNFQKFMSEDYIKKSRIVQLQKMNDQYQLNLKETHQKMNKLNENSINYQTQSQKMKQQLNNLDQKLNAQTNQNIKLSAALQKQKRNVKQAREMCINSSKSYQGLKNKLTQLQTLVNQCTKRQANLKLIGISQQQTIKEYKRKIAELQERQKLQIQKNINSSLLQTFYSQQKLKNHQLQSLQNQQKVKNAELSKQISQKDQQIFYLNGICQTKKSEIKKLNADFRLLQERTAEILKKNSQRETQGDREKAQLSFENEKLKIEINQLKSSLQERSAQIRRMNVAIQRQNNSYEQSSKSQGMIVQRQNYLALILAEREKQFQSLKRQNNLINTNLIQQKKQISKLRDELSQIKKEKQINEAQNKQRIEQLRQKSKDCTAQIQNLKKNIQRLQQQENNKKLSKSLQTKQSLQLQQQNLKSLQILTKQQEISKLLELNERQSNIITELTRSFQQLQNNNLFLNQRLSVSNEESKILHQSMEYLQKEISNLKQKDKLSVDNCQRLSQEMNLIQIELTLARSDHQRRENNQIIALRNIIAASESRYQDLFTQFESISVLMMQIQDEKMQLADELFELHEFLKEKGISLPE